jgi:hypothetical protein
MGMNEKMQISLLCLLFDDSIPHILDVPIIPAAIR